MSHRVCVLLCALSITCGPEMSGSVNTSDAVASTATAESTASEPTGGTTAADTMGGTTVVDATAGSTAMVTTEGVGTDVEICQAFCDNAQNSGCVGEDCIATCVTNIENATLMGCGPEWRASTHCEAMHPLNDQCSGADGCASDYLPLDACYYGACVHLGAVSTSSASPGACSWGALMCFGHKLEMRCTATADAQCTCSIDDVEIGTCALGVDLAPMCNGNFAVFTGCCTDSFLAALQE